jgi:hypothetical protein
LKKGEWKGDLEGEGKFFLPKFPLFSKEGAGGDSNPSFISLTNISSSIKGDAGKG